MKATFEPWKEKVVLINKYVSDKNDGNEITLKNALSSESRIDAIKMDIEGAEVKVISNSVDFFMNHPEICIVVCAYHYEDDEEKIKNLLPEYKFKEQGWIQGTSRNHLHPYITRILLFGKKMGG